MNDIHVSKDNISEFEKNWDEALSICQACNIFDIVIGGDVFTSRSSQTLSTLLAVKQAISKAEKNGIEITIAEGNHDKVNLESIFGYNHVFSAPNLCVVDVYKTLVWDNCDFVLLTMSYFPENGSFVEKLNQAVSDTIHLNSDTITGKHDIILYIHEGVQGALGNMALDTEIPQDVLSGFKAVLCGHYHNRVKIKGTNIQYIGSSRQHNFGEDTHKGYTILYSDGSTEFIENKVNCQYLTVEVGFSDEFEPVRKTENRKYKIKVHCTEKEAKLFDRKKYYELGFDKVEMVGASSVESKNIPTEEITAKYDAQGIKKEYLNYCSEFQIDSALGIKYLEDRPCGN